MQGDNHRDVVERIKGELEARGVWLEGACGAFEITKRVAWALRDEGAGLLSKPAGNNCAGYSVDHIVYRNGQGVDILIDAGGKNGATWGKGDFDLAFAGRWRPPFDPGDPIVQPPAPTPAPTPPADPPDVADPYERLVDSIARIVDGLEGVAEALNATNRRLAALEESGVRIHL